MNAVISPIYYLHMAFKAVKVTIILAWKKISSSIVKSRIQAERPNIYYECTRLRDFFN